MVQSINKTISQVNGLRPELDEIRALAEAGGGGGTGASTIAQVEGLQAALDATLHPDPITGAIETTGDFVGNSEGASVRMGGLVNQESTYAGLWFSQANPDTTNYAFLANDGQVYINTPAGDIGYMRVGNVDLVRFGDFSALYPGLLDPLCFDIVQRAYITGVSDNWAGLVVENDGLGAMLDLRNASQSTICQWLQDGTYEGVNVTFEQTVGDKVSLYGNMLGDAGGYCYGLEANFGYHKGSSGHRWYIGHNADDGATASMELNNTGLQLKWGVLNVKNEKTPASASAAGTQGDIVWDSNYMYVCVATNTWKRTALSTW